ncbi:thioesterase [Parafrankia colletiae]|uniref:Thioesterase n=1 Tax=Parafrankia colletiae TaxID=573497 RepID=A0A1S1QLB3_9ACTN|nr:hotdog domain-containing protein [Parafrankia colletiae]MCK9904035.1 PaaI family thioesterase [Frankia sp. Cpl3]OHV33094.1 thioesterase [Parafrankia colletiae]
MTAPAGENTSPDSDELLTPWAVLDDYQCFGCSPHNPHGLQLRFRERPDGLAASFRLGRAHESYPGVVHGGLVGVICDETMGNLLVLRTGRPAFTTAMRVRYLAPMPVDVAHECRARITTELPAADPPGSGLPANGLISAEADILNAAGDLVATARATYRPVDLDAARDRIQLSDRAAGRLADALTAPAAPVTTPVPAAVPAAEES